MVCPYCGMEYDEGFGKCPYCGAKAEGTAGESTSGAADTAFSGQYEFNAVGTRGKLISFLSGKGFLAVSVLLTVMTSICLFGIVLNTSSVLEVVFGVLATVGAWMARSAAKNGELKLKKGMLMSLPVFESVLMMIMVVFFAYMAVMMTIIGVLSLSSIDNARAAFDAMLSSGIPWMPENNFADIIEQVFSNDAAAEQMFYTVAFFGAAVWFAIMSVMSLVAGVFLIISSKSIKKVIVAGNSGDELPKGLKKSGGIVIAGGIIGLFTPLNSLFAVILIIVGAGMRKLASDEKAAEVK